MAASGPSRGHARLRVGELKQSQSFALGTRSGLSRPLYHPRVVRVVSWPQVYTVPVSILDTLPGYRVSAVSVTVHPLPAGLGSLKTFFEIRACLVCSLGVLAEASQATLAALLASLCLSGALLLLKNRQTFFFLSRPQIGRDYPLNLSI